MVTFQGVLTWKSKDIRDMQEVMARNGRDYEYAYNEMKRLFTEKFLGACAEAEARARRALMDDVGDMQKQFERAAHDLLAVAEAVDKVAKKASNFKKRMDAEGARIEKDGVVYRNSDDDNGGTRDDEWSLECKVIMGDARAIENKMGLL